VVAGPTRYRKHVGNMCALKGSHLGLSKVGACRGVHVASAYFSNQMHVWGRAEPLHVHHAPYGLTKPGIPPQQPGFRCVNVALALSTLIAFDFCFAKVRCLTSGSRSGRLSHLPSPSSDDEPVVPPEGFASPWVTTHRPRGASAVDREQGQQQQGRSWSQRPTATDQVPPQRNRG
jgi:hypothetical protein